jgi:extradiol dioxygenase family protein
MGLALTVEQFHSLADRLRQAGVSFIIEPHLRFKGAPGEQYTMFFKDPSGRCLVVIASVSNFPTIQVTTLNSKQ